MQHHQPQPRRETRMGLTVTEKEHWRDRISRRIDKKIETLCAEDANLMDRIQREARALAYRSLGLAELQAELDDIVKQTEALEKRKEQAHNAMLARVQGKPVDAVECGRFYGE